MPQNVVFIITDDQGYGDLGCTGNPVISTPHLDCLYEESVRFTDFHVGPTCAPTRAGLMTGRFHNSTGVWHTVGGRSLLRRDEVSLADIFRCNGYKTGIFGKWHLGDNYPYRPQDRGFDEAVVHGGGGIGQTPDYWGNDYFDDTYYNMGAAEAHQGYCTDVWFRLAMDFMTRQQDNPFFCYIPTNAPHAPFQIADVYADRYRDTEPEVRARFYGMISNIDENVGRLRTFLDDAGLADNTILIFMTDNGTDGGCVQEDGFVVDGYNANMRGKKGSPYEGGHRVPFFLHRPGMGFAGGRDIDTLAANVDVLPTIVELVGLDLPCNLDLDGRSLYPLLQGRSVSWEERVLVTDSQRVPIPVKWKDSAIMKGKWRLINGCQLYDLTTDPEQRNDCAGVNLKLTAAMRTAYDIWWNKVSSRFEEEIPISIGSVREPTTRITSHDWRGDVGDCAWNQGEIRAGKECNSYVELFVEQAGTYSFELRRWPQEEDRALAEGIPGDRLDWFTGGEALPIRQAVIRVGNQERSAEADPRSPSVTFELRLEPGPTHMQTYFIDETGSARGAYFVYVTRAHAASASQ